MSTDKLSKPVQIFKHPAGRNFWSVSADSNAGQQDVEAFYSQEYVSALLAELEAKDERIKWLESISTDYISKSQKAQECIAELEAQVKVWESAALKHLALAEEAEKRLEESRETTLLVRDAWQKDKERADAAEKQLATPVRLPGSFYPDGDIECPLVVELDEVIGSIHAAGFTVEGYE
ncbi:hypothetical protein [Serratia sp. TKO39]|uniref:hypothetical protein n=1 Tax=Serratia sp. TKO39 TaxID=2052589 RepID=UPI000C235936|nr:hypothetical protein [Serratia sp. TKO39]PJI66996.1 hypothetical protein CUN64_17435 [Serratia sp. TKO39]